MNQAGPPSGNLSTFGTQPSSQPDEPVLPQNLRKAPEPDAADTQILSEIHAKKARSHESFRNHRAVTPFHQKKSPNGNTSQVTAAPDPATIELARNDDRNVESLARETNRLHPRQDDEEVIVSLH
jgi:hypothetical protein